MESSPIGSVENGLGEIQKGRRCTPSFLLFLPGRVGRRGFARERQASEVQAEVPLADDAGVVTVRLEERGDGGAIGFNQWSAITVEDSRFQSATPTIATGQQAITGGRTDGRRGVRVGETDALIGKPIEVWRRDPGIAIDRLHIAVAHVVGQDDNNVGWAFGREWLRSRYDPGDQ